MSDVGADGKPIGDRRVTDAAGVAFIPASRRPDGTWRKEIRVKPGYVPPEEVSAYVPKAARESAVKSTGLPVGIDPSMVPAVKGRGAAGASKPAAATPATADTAAARKNARRREKRAEERKAAEEEALAQRLAAAALGDSV